MLKIIDKSTCTGCYACAGICKSGAITLKKDTEGFYYPVVNDEKCVKCGLCVQRCPVHNQEDSNSILKSYSAFYKNDKIRELSSSGGVFTYLSEQILSDGGVVFGAAFDNDYNVQHIYIEDVNELNQLRSSKYMQSQIRDSFVQAKTFLDTGRKVLFTGTPCQIAGLKAFLHKDYPNLYTQDIICHGVPSPKVWQKYLSSVNTENKKIDKISFRSKRNGWKNYGLEITYADDTDYFCEFKQNAYSKAFLNNLCLRPSCYKCAFKNAKPFSDITLADYWGVDIVSPHLDDDRGLSAVMVNSKKGEELFFNKSENLNVEDLDFSVITKHNPSLVTPSYMHKKRDYFMSKVDVKSFDELVEKCTKPRKTPVVISFAHRALSKIKRTVCKK